MPEKYYFAQNSNRVIKGAGYEFLFSPVDTLGGITRGVYATTNESEQIALASIVSRSGGDIFELEKEDYDNRVKKKAPELQNSKVLLPKANPMVAMSSPQGVVVENPVAHETETIPGPIVESIDSVLKTGPVKAFDPGPLKKKAKGKK